MHGQQRAHASRELTCGFAAGAANVLSGYPFDTVKVRLQASNGLYSGMLDCFRHIWQEEGVRGLYRGVGVPLVGGAAETAVNYLVYSKVLEALKAPGEERPHMQTVPVAAAVAGMALSVILGPTELLKCRLQMGQQQSVAACVRVLLRNEGPKGLLRGFGATLAREVPGNAIFFSVYEGLRRTLPGRPGSSNSSHGSGSGGGGGSGGSSSGGSGGSGSGDLGAVALDAASAIFCGGMAGVVMWASVLPIDVAKTRIQTAHPGEPWDTSVVNHLRMLWKEGGRRSLWAGLTPTITRAFPANACQWLAWEFCMRQYRPSDVLEPHGTAHHQALHAPSLQQKQERQQQQERQRLRHQAAAVPGIS